MLEHNPIKVFDFLGTPPDEKDLFENIYKEVFITLTENDVTKRSSQIFETILAFKTEYLLYAPQEMRDYIECSNFDSLMLSNMLETKHDELYGIKTRYMQHRVFEKPFCIRDARQATHPNNQPKPDDIRITTLNMLQRCLARFRAIDFALRAPSIITQEFSENLSARLLSALQVLFNDAASLKQQPLDLEKKFNNSAISILHEAGLTTGLSCANDLMHLLSFYRYLSSTISPASGLCTLNNDNYRLLYFDTEIPITFKTAQQVEALKCYTVPGPYAYQQAFNIFKECIMDHHTMLPAQIRKTIAPTLKFAYLVDSRICANDQMKSTLHSITSTRSASFTYTGPGLCDKEIQQHTLDNLEQLHLSVDNILSTSIKPNEEPPALKLHVTLLNTNSLHENQYIIVKHVSQALSTRGEHLSNIPTNFEGWFRRNQIAPIFQHVKLPFSFGKAATCVQNAATIALSASKNNNFISHICCASGQNRTLTVLEKHTQMFIQQSMINSMGKPIYSAEQIQLFRLVSLHNNRAVTLHEPGSPGFKAVSQIKGLFIPLFDERMYTLVADTKRKSPANSAEIKVLISTLSATATDDLKKLHQQISNHSPHRLKEPAIQVSRALEAAVHKHQTTPQLIDDARTILHIVLQLMDQPNTSLIAIQQLINASNKFSRRSNWARVVNAINILITCALLAITIATAIPSVGLSLSLSLSLNLTLTANTLSAIGASLTTIAAVISAAIMHLNRDHQLVDATENLVSTWQGAPKKAAFMGLSLWNQTWQGSRRKITDSHLEAGSTSLDNIHLLGNHSTEHKNY